MAYDILKGSDDSRSWSRGDATTSATIAAAKRLPWIPILFGLGAGAGALFLLSGRRPAPPQPLPAETYHRRPTRPTIQVPYETMRETVYGRNS